MRKLKKFVPVLFVLLLTLAVGVALAVPVSGSKDSNTETMTKNARKASPTKATKSTATKTSHTLASAEDLTGTITSVDPADKELTLVGSNGVLYDFMVNKRTKIELSNKKIAVSQLASESHEPATIHFVPKSNGNMAENIQIKTS